MFPGFVDTVKKCLTVGVRGEGLLVTFVIMWVRFSYPRFREDQLQRFAWKVLIPVSLVNIMVTAVLKVVF